MRIHGCLALLALALVGCGSSGVSGTELGPMPRGAQGFPAMTFGEFVYAQAAWVNHERDLDVDTVEEADVLPIELQVRLAGGGQQGAQILLDPDRANLRLYLPDGTVLPSVSMEDIEPRISRRKVDRVRDLSFKGGLLTEENRKGFVFFALEPGGKEAFEIDGRNLRHNTRGVVRSMDLADSVVAFELSVGTGGAQVQNFYVGIQ